MFYMYNDPKRWGMEIGTRLAKLGQPCRMFNDISKVGDEGIVFMHVNHLPLEEREKCKQIMNTLSDRPGLRLIPSARQSRLYDDKVAEFKDFGGWMPETFLFEDESEAMANVGCVGFPHISKAAQGAGASNVRLHREASWAEGEVRAAFSEAGLPCYKGLAQKGYVLWQKFIPDLEVNWRVVVLGYKYAFITKRWNESGTNMVNDRGVIENLDQLDNETRPILEFAHKFVMANKFQWAAVDIICDPNPHARHCHVLELSCDWPMWWFEKREGQIFCKNGDGAWNPQRPVTEIYDFIADFLVEGLTNETLF